MNSVVGKEAKLGGGFQHKNHKGLSIFQADLNSTSLAARDSVKAAMNVSCRPHVRGSFRGFLLYEDYDALEEQGKLLVKDGQPTRWRKGGGQSCWYQC